MARDLVRRTSQLQRIPRDVVRRVEAAHHQGLVSAARVASAAYVTHVALSLTGQLTDQEGRFVQMYPMAEARFRMLVDNFTAVACAEIAGLGF